MVRESEGELPENHREKEKGRREREREREREGREHKRDTAFGGKMNRGRVEEKEEEGK